jgi:predicted RecB family nuclease
MNLDRWLYQSGLQCQKRMYWQSRERRAAGRTFELVQRFSQEARVAARALWPDGVAVSGSLSEDAAQQETRRLLEEGQARVIFGAALESDGVAVRVDVLERSRRMKWYLTSVKSGSQMQDRHVQDLALQVWVARAAGLDVREAAVAMVNRHYVRNGELDPGALFEIRNATPRVEAALERVAERARSFREVLALLHAPSVEVGAHCDDPYPCEFGDDCWPALDRDDIRLLPALHGHRKRELWNAGVRRIGEIPDAFVLNERQRRAKQSIEENRLLWSDHLRAELESLTYPLWCIDFEAVAPAVPRYPGCRPWQQIPFQWSAHRVDEPGAEPVHTGFLAETAGDPRRDFAESLLEAVGRDGPVLVWSKQFEDARLKELQAEYPDLSGRLVALRERLVDLLEIVRKNVYHPEFHGSFSIKRVLPALVPELSYDGLSVSKGDEASLTFDRLCRDGLNAEEAAGLRAGLEEYCRMDTLAMVRILAVLRSRAFARTAP